MVLRCPLSQLTILDCDIPTSFFQSLLAFVAHPVTISLLLSLYISVAVPLW